MRGDLRDSCSRSAPRWWRHRAVLASLFLTEELPHTKSSSKLTVDTNSDPKINGSSLFLTEELLRAAKAVSSRELQSLVAIRPDFAVPAEGVAVHASSK